jgi:hypothetical protein
MTTTVSFETTLTASGNNTGIVVPDDAIEKLGGGKRPAVHVTINEYEYRNTIAVMGGQSLISVSAAIRKETGLKAGDPIRVSLKLADAPRAVEVPPDFQAALTKQKTALTFFTGLSNSLQRYHVDNINNAKTPDTRQRRIERAITLFLAGQQR